MPCESRDILSQKYHTFTTLQLNSKREEQRDKEKSRRGLQTIISHLQQTVKETTEGYDLSKS